MLWVHRLVFKRFLSKVVCRVNSYSSNEITNILKKMSTTTKTYRVTESQLQARASYEVRKEKNKNLAPGTKKFWIEVLGNGANGSPRAVNLYADTFRGLFNCGESTQRLAGEYGVKISKIPHVFITYGSWENVSGLLGVALSMQATGIPELYIHGPRTVENVFSATNKFVALRTITLKLIDCLQESEFEDPNVSIKYVPLFASNPSQTKSEKRPSTAESPKPLTNILEKYDSCEDDDDVDYYAHLSKGKRKKQTLEKANGNKKQRSRSMVCNSTKNTVNNYVVSYICRSKDTLGTLMIEKCVDLGVPCGPLLGKLKSGESVTLDDGRVVHSSDVTTPNIPGGIVIVVECPSEDFLDSLLQEPLFFRHQTGDSVDIASVVLHFTNSQILSHAKYQEWISRFPSQTRHVFVNEKNKSLSSICVHRNQEKLNMIHPEIFPLLPDSGIPVYPRTASESTAKGHEHVELELSEKTKTFDHVLMENWRSAADLNLFHKLNFKCVENSFINGETLLQVPIRPLTYYDYSRNLVLKKESFIQEVLKIPGAKEKIANLKKEISQIELTDETYPKILFLGTGSSVPNKTRNTSGIMVYTNENTYILLDCGEGTYNQMVVFYGREKAYEILRNLNVIYVSHLHADHHIGLITILKRRRMAFIEKYGSDNMMKPVILLAPIQLTRWLNLFDQEFDKIADLYSILPNSHLMDFTLSKNKYEECLNLLNMKEIRTTLVKHCKNAYGVALTHNDGWKLTYSGDTMPCDQLVELGRDSDVLIHEATMDHSLAKIASIKLHSTNSQAIKVGKAMNARFTILTHFSQRYSHLPIINEDFTENVGIAFDNMIVSLNQLPLLSKFIPVLKTVYSEYYSTMENKRDLFLIKENKKANGNIRESTAEEEKGNEKNKKRNEMRKSPTRMKI